MCPPSCPTLQTTGEMNTLSTLTTLTLIILEGHMANVAIDHGVGGEVGGWPGALEQRHGGTGFDFRNSRL